MSDRPGEDGFLTAANVAAIGLSLVVLAVMGSVAAGWAQVGVIRGVTADVARETSAGLLGPDECTVAVRIRVAEIAPRFVEGSVACRMADGVVVVSIDGTIPTPALPIRGVPVRHEVWAVLER